MNKLGRPKKKLCGIGINDADYLIEDCPFYRTWAAMIGRCYNAKVQARQATYIGCSVTPEWRVFSVFKAWMEKQDWEGKHLDKDLLLPGNKVYRPETCVFVSPFINGMLTRLRGQRGFHWNKHAKQFQVQGTIMGSGKRVTIGYADNILDARAMYLAHRKEYIREVISRQKNTLIIRALEELF